MNCPNCDEATRVIDSRKWAGTVYRKRRCGECACTFWTVEEDASPRDVNRMLAGIKAEQRAKKRAKAIKQ